MDTIILIVGVIILYVVLKYIIVKSILDIFIKIFSNKYTFSIIIVVGLGYLFFPLLFKPYIDFILNWFINSIIGLFDLLKDFIIYLIGLFIN